MWGQRVVVEGARGHSARNTTTREILAVHGTRNTPHCASVCHGVRSHGGFRQVPGHGHPTPAAPATEGPPVAQQVERTPAPTRPPHKPRGSGARGVGAPPSHRCQHKPQAQLSALLSTARSPSRGFCEAATVIMRS